MVDTAPYGSWASPLSAEWASAASPRYEGARFVGAEVWWGQSLPDEGGRTAVFRRSSDSETDLLLPAPWNARSRVHEYGGGGWTSAPDGRLFFVEKSDGRVWQRSVEGEITALTPPDVDVWFGGLSFQEGVLLAVQETPERRAIVSIRVDGTWEVTEVAADSDFVAQPVLSPGGTHLAWTAWNHPDMPWDRTEIRVGRLTDGTVTHWASVTSGESSALQPHWLTDDDLLFTDDSSGWWNLTRLHLNAALDRTPVAAVEADTGGGLWTLALRWFGVLGDGRIVAVRTHGTDSLVLIDTDGTERTLDVPATGRLTVEHTDGSRVLVAGATGGASGVWLVDVDGGTEPVAGGVPDVDDAWIPLPRQLEADGPHGTVHAFDFPPTNPEISVPNGERPPYLVTVHGGPTGNASGVADAETMYFTSRGIGVLDVNYGGSTGYGRAYRERLKGRWGVVDADDVAAAAQALAASGAADATRIAIEGGSAGGWTVLASLVRTDAFAAGISRYGVGDARTLATDTHEFESRYLDGMIGPLPEAAEIYRERSPLTHADRFRVPMLLLQGDEDRIVPPSQAEAIRDALRERNVPHAYVLFEGEGHGFRGRETIVRALELTIAFLGVALGFEPADVPPLDLD